MSEHPIDRVLSRMSERDRRIAEILMESGCSEEDLYAALPNQNAVKLLTAKQKMNHKSITSASLKP